MPNRRDIIGIFALISSLGVSSYSQARPQDHTDHEAMMADIPGLSLMGNERILMIGYQQMTALDLVGPQYFFAGLMGAKVEIATTDAQLSPIITDTGLGIMPSVTLGQASDDYDLIFLPGGGAGTLKAMEDRALISFLQAAAPKAKFVTSACTGSLILAAAGLLKGKRATSHWAAREALSDFGAIPIDERIVSDGKIITGAGVSAGIDMAIEVTRRLRGDPYAQGMMLLAEYAPAPPIKGGTPETTEPRLRAMMDDMLSPIKIQAKAIAARSKI